MRILSNELKTITPDMARYLRTDCPYDRQRPIRARKVEMLARDMRAGRFAAGTAVHIGVLDGHQAVLDGNHRLEAVIAAGIGVSFSILTVEYAGAKEMAIAYSKMDVGLKRTIRDSMRAADMMPEVISDTNFHTRLAAALRVRISDFKRSSSLEMQSILNSHEMVMAAMQEYMAEAEAYYTALAGTANRVLLYRSQVMAVALETLHYQPSGGFDFWQGTAADDGLRQGDARKTLLRWLQDNPGGNSGIAETTSRAAALAWNAHVQGRDLGILRPSSMATMHIAGTAWRGAGHPAPQLRCVAKELAIQARAADDTANATRADPARAPLRGLRVANDGRLVAVAHGVEVAHGPGPAHARHPDRPDRAR